MSSRHPPPPQDIFPPHALPVHFTDSIMSDWLSRDTLPLGESSLQYGSGSPPALSLRDIDSFDDTPFSESFSGWMETERPDADKSYNIEQITDIQQLLPDWEDDDVDEIMVMSPKPRQRESLTTIYEDANDVAYGTKRNVTMNEFEVLEGPLHQTLCRRRSTGKIFALKRAKPSEHTSSQKLSIMDAVNGLYAPFLARMQCNFIDNDILHIVLDAGLGGDLFSFVSPKKQLKPGLVLLYASELVEALNSLHLSGIVHRTVCPENIYIDSEGHILLSGFDDAAFLDERNGESNARSYHGIVRIHREHHCEYRAPEVLLGWETSKLKSQPLVLTLLTVFQHAFGLDDNVNLHNVLYGGVSLDFTIPLSSVARDLILQCVVKNPRLRISMTSIRGHEYFGHIDWRQVQDKKLKVPVPFIKPSPINNMQPTTPSGFPQMIHTPTLDHSSGGPPPSSNSTISMISLDTDDLQTNSLPPISCSASVVFTPELSSYECAEAHDKTTLTVASAFPTVTDFRTTAYESSSPQTKMALFWQTLDEESPSRDSLPLARLRKQKSFPVLDSSRLSLLVPNKLRKKLLHSNSHATLKTPEPLNLPKGIEQIGHGIGFTYSIPAAVVSKASICPRNCHSIPPFGLGLKKTGGKLPANVSCAVKASMEAVAHPRCSGHSDSQLIVDDRSPYSEQIFSPTSTDSPLSEAGPLTPPQDSFKFSTDIDILKSMPPSSTLRLVSPSTSVLSLGSHPFYNLLEFA
ncbi:kinase-like protein [Hymenopellis radicata]|nr:kinase-like protein [Hymenopellis radicata]